MWSIHSASYKQLFLLVLLAALLTFVIAACGGSGSGIGSTPTPTPTSVQGSCRDMALFMAAQVMPL